MAITITSTSTPQPFPINTGSTWGSYTTITCSGSGSSHKFDVGNNQCIVSISTNPFQYTPSYYGDIGRAQKHVRGFNRDGIVRNYSGDARGDITVESTTASSDTLFFASQTNGAIKGVLDIAAQAYNSSTQTITASMFRQINFLYSWNASGTITQRLNATNSCSYTSDATNLPVTKGTLVAVGNNVHLRCSRYSTNANITTYYSIKCFLIDTFETHADLYGFGKYNISPGHGTGYY